MKIVFDTNCLVRVLPKKSPYYCLWDVFRRGKITLCYTTEILQEYEELLLRFYAPDIVLLTMETLLKLPNVIQTIPYYKWNLIAADPDDNKFVDCDLNAGADFIVTNDRHFNILKTFDFPPVKVINIETFKSILNL
jgi:putative PIN family toxin of toxin-antitoxin system